MKDTTPMSEDFLFWDPEDISNYPDARKQEDQWFYSMCHEEVVNTALTTIRDKLKRSKNEY